jgi:DNA-binding IclR family transcriptional regulator
MEDFNMTHEFKELKQKTVAQLKEIAKEIDHEAVQGYTQMNKEHLLEAICKALGIDTFEHHQVIGIDKTKIKEKIKQLKKERDQALGVKDHVKLKSVRKQIKHLKKKLRRSMV